MRSLSWILHRQSFDDARSREGGGRGIEKDSGRNGRSKWPKRRESFPRRWREDGIVIFAKCRKEGRVENGGSEILLIASWSNLCQPETPGSICFRYACTPCILLFSMASRPWKRTKALQRLGWHGMAWRNMTNGCAVWKMELKMEKDWMRNPWLSVIWPVDCIFSPSFGMSVS